MGWLKKGMLENVSFRRTTGAFCVFALRFLDAVPIDEGASFVLTAVTVDCRRVEVPVGAAVVVAAEPFGAAIGVPWGCAGEGSKSMSLSLSSA